MEILQYKEINEATAVRLTWTSQHGIESYLFTIADAIKVIEQLQNKFNIWIIVFKL
jgi:hypothetical protein